MPSQKLLRNGSNPWSEIISRYIYRPTKLVDSWATTLGHQTPRILLWHPLPGHQNRVADVLSRRNIESELLLLTFSSLYPPYSKPCINFIRTIHSVMNSSLNAKMILKCRKFSMWLEDLSFLRTDCIFPTLRILANSYYQNIIAQGINTRHAT